VRVEFLPAAKRELFATTRFYDARSQGLGDALLDEVERAILLILQMPGA
jgi:hypothetical protein